MKKLFLLCILVYFFTPVKGQETFELKWNNDATILGISAGMIGLGYYIQSQKPSLSLTQIRIIENAPPNYSIIDGNAVFQYDLMAKKNSDILVYTNTTLPLMLMLSPKLSGKYGTFLVMYGEVLAVNGGLTLLAKVSANRIRPYVFNKNIPASEKMNPDARFSFYSSHTSQSAAMTFFAARMFAKLYPYSRIKPVIWGIATILPLVTGYQRYLAGQHFPSDIYVGFAIGATVGYLIPGIHSVFKKKDIVIAGTPSGIGLNMRF